MDRGDALGAVGAVAGLGMMAAGSVASGAPGADVVTHVMGTTGTFVAGAGVTIASIGAMIFK
ncbi:MAG: hypothetical protein ACP5N9_02345 [Candidatus Bilamarchaeum sp.]|jgi:hypothetical protein